MKANESVDSEYCLYLRIDHARRHPPVGCYIRVVLGMKAVSTAQNRTPVLDCQQHGSSLEALLLNIRVDLADRAVLRSVPFSVFHGTEHGTAKG